MNDGIGIPELVEVRVSWLAWLTPGYEKKCELLFFFASF